MFLGGQVPEGTEAAQARTASTYSTPKPAPLATGGAGGEARHLAGARRAPGAAYTAGAARQP
eukprot:668900-Alexandrium_andersonii.AAC.1